MQCGAKVSSHLKCKSMPVDPAWGKILTNANDLGSFFLVCMPADGKP